MLIGEVARRSGVSARMLRHYDTLGLVRPTGRTVGGYREYSADDLRRIFHVESLRSLGLSLGQIGRALDDPGFTPSDLVGDLIRWTRERMARQAELLERLTLIEAADPTGWSDVLRVVELLRGLDSTSAARRQQAALAGPEDAAVPVERLAEAALTEGDPHVAGALRWALARAGEAGIAALAAAARSGDADTRRRAALAVADMVDDVPDSAIAIDVLAAALEDEDRSVRERAALALGRRGVAAAAPTLVAMVVQGRDDVDAAEALAVLSDDPTRGERIVAALAEALAAPTADAPVRIRLAQALVELGGPAARAVVDGLTRDEDRAVALVATALSRGPSSTGTGGPSSSVGRPFA